MMKKSPFNGQASVLGPLEEVYRAPALKSNRITVFSDTGISDTAYCPYLLLAGELHLPLRNLTAEMVHFTS